MICTDSAWNLCRICTVTVLGVCVQSKSGQSVQEQALKTLRTLMWPETTTTLQSRLLLTIDLSSCKRVSYLCEQQNRICSNDVHQLCYPDSFANMMARSIHQ